MPHSGKTLPLVSIVEAARFDYNLPKEAIAQVPASRRDQSRLLLVNRATGQVADHLFKELPDLLPKMADLFRNDVKVIKARLSGRRPGGGEVECLLLHPSGGYEGKEWWCLLKPGKKLPAGSTFESTDFYMAEVLEKNEDGAVLVRFDLKQHNNLTALAEAIGVMPLPPYIQRGELDEDYLDNERYQTVYANPQKPYAVAAPTAGLHFTDQVIERMRESGHRFHDLTLHVGLGTFKPIQSEMVEHHLMHKEYYEIPQATRTAMNNRTNNKLKLAVGTTSLRAMEDYYRYTRRHPDTGEGTYGKDAEIFIFPPDYFTTDALLTNFHLPRSTLLCLVSAFLTPGSTDGIAWLKQLYAAALKRNYRFYSYGDAMLIL